MRGAVHNTLSRKPESTDLATQAAAAADNQPKQIRTRLAVTSMISYF